MQSLTRWFALSALAVSLSISGCSSGSSGPPIPTFSGEGVPIAGVISLDGAPLGDANVTFMKDGGPNEQGVSGSGKTDMSGKYVIRTGGKAGIPAGRYRVVISKLATKDGSPFVPNPEQGLDLEQARMNGMVKESVPPKYSDAGKTTLSVEVTAGQDPKQDFELKSK